MPSWFSSDQLSHQHVSFCSFPFLTPLQIIHIGENSYCEPKMSLNRPSLNWVSAVCKKDFMVKHTIVDLIWSMHLQREWTFFCIKLKTEFQQFVSKISWWSHYCCSLHLMCSIPFQRIMCVLGLFIEALGHHNIDMADGNSHEGTQNRLHRMISRFLKSTLLTKNILLRNTFLTKNKKTYKFKEDKLYKLKEEKLLKNTPILIVRRRHKMD